jgi:hypothetical protein
MRMSKPKNHGKDKTRVFLDVFSLPENKSRVHFPVKNLDPPLTIFVVFCCPVLYLQWSSTGDVFRDTTAREGRKSVKFPEKLLRVLRID